MKLENLGCFDLVKNHVAHTYPKTDVLFVNKGDVNDIAELDVLWDALQAVGIEIPQNMRAQDYLFIEMQELLAIQFINQFSNPNTSIYMVCFRNGEPIHENV